MGSPGSIPTPNLDEKVLILILRNNRRLSAYSIIWDKVIATISNNDEEEIYLLFCIRNHPVGAVSIGHYRWIVKSFRKADRSPFACASNSVARFNLDLLEARGSVNNKVIRHRLNRKQHWIPCTRKPCSSNPEAGGSPDARARRREDCKLLHSARKTKVRSVQAQSCSHMLCIAWRRTSPLAQRLHDVGPARC